MKAISDVKMKKIIQKMRAAGATYEIGDNEGDYSLQDALIEQANRMKPGEERLVYFYDNIPSCFGEGYGIAKLYCHEGAEQGGSIWVCAELFSGSTRSYMNVVKSDIDGTWHCTEQVNLPNGIGTETLNLKVNAAMYEFTINHARKVSVVVSDGGRIHYEVSLDVDYLRYSDEVHEYWTPFSGSLVVSLIGNKLKLSLEDASEGDLICSVRCYY